MPQNIEVVDYDPEWERFYKDEAQKIKRILGSNCIETCHIGSTAVKGMGAEPTLDILCVVSNTALVDIQNPALAVLGYEPVEYQQLVGQRVYRGKREQSVPDAFLTKEAQKEQEESHICNLYMFNRTNKRDINRFLVVRDYLRGHQSEADEFVAIKRRLAQQYEDDIEGYIAAKEPYLDQIEQSALEWQRQQDRLMSYMAIGMCVGTAVGAVCGTLLDHTGVGLSYGVSFGMLAGLTIAML